MKRFNLISGVCLLFFAAGCDHAPLSTLVSEPLRDRPGRAEGAPLFEKLTSAQTGVEFSHRMAMKHPLSRLNSSGFVCGGVCIGDFNGDGRPDLFLANGPDKNGLFLQRDGFRFENVTQNAGVDGGDAWASGAAAVDFDADGETTKAPPDAKSPAITVSKSLLSKATR